MFTIGDFFELNLFEWTRNLTGGLFQHERPIEYVSVNDLPLDDFIRENEMVIAIATPYIGNDDRMYEFIDGLIKAKASIFLLAIPNNQIELSPRNKAYAQKHSLAIFQIPWEYRFADIIEKVTDEIRASGNKLLKVLEKCQNELLKSYLNGNDIEQAQEIMSQFLKRKVYIHRFKPDEESFSSQNYSELTLKQGNMIYGYIYINAKLTYKTKSLILKILGSVLMLWFYKDDIIKKTQYIVKDDFIWSLINSEYISDEMIHIAESMGMHLEKSFSCIIGQINFKKKLSINTWLNANIADISNIIQATAKAMGREIIQTSQRNLLIIFLENAPYDSRKNVNAFLDKTEQVISDSYPGIYFSWGISEIKNESTDFNKYFTHAKLAKELCANGHSNNNYRYSYEETLIFDMLSVLSAEKEFIQRAHSIISPLLEYDKSKQTNLANTLRAYLSKRNISKAAESINMHRQTFIYQINKIEELLDISLKNPETLFLLEICLRLHFDFHNT